MQGMCMFTLGSLSRAIRQLTAINFSPGLSLNFPVVRAIGSNKLSKLYSARDEKVLRDGQKVKEHFLKEL